MIKTRTIIFSRGKSYLASSLSWYKIKKKVLQSPYSTIDITNDWIPLAASTVFTFTAHNQTQFFKYVINIGLR